MAKKRRSKSKRKTTAAAVKPKPKAGGWGSRPLREYYEITKTPLLILLVWSVFGFFLNYMMLMLTAGFVGSITAVMQLAAGVYIGHLTVSKFGDKISDAAISGVLCGFIIGVLIMVFELLMGQLEMGVAAPVAGMLFVGVPAVIGAYIFKKK